MQGCKRRPLGEIPSGKAVPEKPVKPVARVATKFSKHRTLIAATIGYVLALVAIPMLPKGQLPAATAAIFMAGFFYLGSIF